YEEDCEWAKVVHTFPQYFTNEQYQQAISSLKNWFPDSYTEVTGEEVKPEESQKVLERKFYEDNLGKWICVSATRYNENQTECTCHKVVRTGKKSRYDNLDMIEARKYLVDTEEYRIR